MDGEVWYGLFFWLLRGWCNLTRSIKCITIRLWYCFIIINQILYTVRLHQYNWLRLIMIIIDVIDVNNAAGTWLNFHHLLQYMINIDSLLLLNNPPPNPDWYNKRTPNNCKLICWTSLKTITMWECSLHIKYGTEFRGWKSLTKHQTNVFTTLFIQYSFSNYCFEH